VLGTGALFSTAYGNVGSSIYYAHLLPCTVRPRFRPLICGNRFRSKPPPAA
jgi:hypothetical protein